MTREEQTCRLIFSLTIRVFRYHLTVYSICTKNTKQKHLRKCMCKSLGAKQCIGSYCRCNHNEKKKLSDILPYHNIVCIDISVKLGDVILESLSYAGFNLFAYIRYMYRIKRCRECRSQRQTESHLLGGRPTNLSHALVRIRTSIAELTNYSSEKKKKKKKKKKKETINGRWF